MTYKIMMANGGRLIERKVCGVRSVLVEGDVYFFTDATGMTLFSAPVNSVVYIEQV